MITNVLWRKKENNKDYYFNYKNPNEKDQALQFGNRMTIDAIEWNYKNKKYEISFAAKEFGDVLIEKDKIFIQYQTAEASFTAPNNIVIYTPTAEIEKVLTTPILPNGKKGGGFLQINKIISNKNNNLIREFENHLEVWVWEDERSPWIYHYFFNIDTYEFIFRLKSRY
ncbi:hypothetical protein [Capnocytophaga leadbetteri]|uniref:hypothetical protein n=1 Tax=Capnocytophaga leadbetteri TaxID=327575 RepID=UPI0028E9E637|nr:hypothetical protein [Capnocytophaga leadbetteri]